MPAASWLSCAALAAIDGELFGHLAAGAPADPGAQNPKGPGLSLRRRSKGLVDQPAWCQLHRRARLPNRRWTPRRSCAPAAPGCWIERRASGWCTAFVLGLQQLPGGGLQAAAAVQRRSPAVRPGDLSALLAFAGAGRQGKLGKHGRHTGAGRYHCPAGSQRLREAGLRPQAAKSALVHNTSAIRRKT